MGTGQGRGSNLGFHSELESGGSLGKGHCEPHEAPRHYHTQPAPCHHCHKVAFPLFLNQQTYANLMSSSKCCYLLTEQSSKAI